MKFWMMFLVSVALYVQGAYANSVEESAYMAQHIAVLELQAKLCPFVANDQKFLIALQSLKVKYVQNQDPVFMQEYVRTMEAGREISYSAPIPTAQQCSDWFAGAKQKVIELYNYSSK